MRKKRLAVLGCLVMVIAASAVIISVLLLGNHEAQATKVILAMVTTIAQDLKRETLNCESGVLQVYNDISWRAVESVKIPENKSLWLQYYASDEHTTAVLSGVGCHALFEVRGMLSLEGLTLTHVNVSTGTGVVVFGENAEFDLIGGTIATGSAPITLQNGSRFGGYAVVLESQQGSSIVGCPTCEIEIYTGDIYLYDTGIPFANAGSIEIFDVRVYSNGSVVSVNDAEGSNVVFADAKKLYLPHTQCDRLVKLEIFSSEAHESVVRCLSECDILEECSGARWLPGNKSESVNSTCEIYSTTSGCTPVDYSAVKKVYVDVYHIVDRKMPYVKLDVNRWCPERFAVVNNVSFPSLCRSWCNINPQCVGVHFRSATGDCELLNMITACPNEAHKVQDSVNNTLEVRDDLEYGYTTVATSCRLPTNHLQIIDSVQSGDGKSCELLCQMDKFCDGVLHKLEECHLVVLDDDASIAQRCTQPDGEFELRVSPRSRRLQFPKREFVHLQSNNLCLVSESIVLGEFSKPLSCSSECSSSSSCVGFEEVDDDCHFTSTVALDSCLSKRSVGLVHRMFQFVDDMSPPQFKTTSIVDTTLMSCQAVCWFSTDCTRCAFDLLTSTCFVESVHGELFPLTESIGNTTYVFELQTSTFNATFQQNLVVDNITFYSYGLEDEMITENAQVCGLVCSHHRRCRYWRWSSPSTCRLFEDGNLVVNDDDERLGLDLNIWTGDWKARLDGRPARRYLHVVNHTCFPLEPMLSVNTGDEQECMAVCESLRGCGVYLISSDSECFLFASHVETCDNATSNIGDLYVAYSEYEFQTVSTNLCLDGTQVASEHGVTVEQCKHFCATWTDDRCLSFEYNWESGVCKLFRGSAVKKCDVSNSAHLDSFISVEKFLDEEDSFVAVPHSCPLENFVLEQYENYTVDQCRRKCQLEDDCRSFVFDRDSRQCQLRDGARSKPCNLENTIHVVKYQSNRYSNSFFSCGPSVGYDVHGVTLETCAAVCDNMIECVSFTFERNDTICHLHDSYETRQASYCNHNEFFVPQNHLMFTRDENQRCGSNPLLLYIRLTLDECLALCNKNEQCMAVNYDHNLMKCLLHGDIARHSCASLGEQCLACDGALYVSFGYTTKHEMGFAYARGTEVCHRTNGTENLPYDLQGSMEFCQRQCSEDESCKTVSIEQGICVFGGEAEGSFSCNEDVMLKVPLNRYTRLLNVEMENPTPEPYYPRKTRAECQSLCRSKHNCVDVVTNSSGQLGCSLSSSRDFTAHGNNPDAVVTSDIWVEQNRFSFHFEQGYDYIVNAPTRKLSIRGMFDVLSVEDCGFLCYNDPLCLGFEFGLERTSMVLSSDSRYNCVLYKVNWVQDDRLYDKSFHETKLVGYWIVSLPFVSLKFDYHKSDMNSAAECNNFCANIDESVIMFTYGGATLFANLGKNCYCFKEHKDITDQGSFSVKTGDCSKESNMKECSDYPAGKVKHSCDNRADNEYPGICRNDCYEYECTYTRPEKLTVERFEIQSSPTSKFYKRSNATTEALWPGNELDARLWVRTPNGRAGRSLMFSVTSLKRETTRVVEKVVAISTASGAILAIIAPLLESVHHINVKSIDSAKMVKVLRKALLWVVNLVKPLLKPLGTIVEAILKKAFIPFASFTLKVGLAAIRGVQKLKAFEVAAEFLDGLLNVAPKILLPIGVSLMSIASILTNAHQCAFEAKQMSTVSSLEDSMERLYVLSESMRKNLMEIEEEVVNPLDQQRNKLLQLTSKINSVLDKFQKFDDFLDKFDWLIDVALFEFCVNGLGCFTLVDLVNYLNPLGFLLGLMTDPLTNLFQSLFPEFRFPLPQLDVSEFDFLEEYELNFNDTHTKLMETLTKPAEEVQQTLEDLKSSMPEHFVSCERLSGFESEFENFEDEQDPAQPDESLESERTFTRVDEVPRFAEVGVGGVMKDLVFKKLSKTVFHRIEPETTEEETNKKTKKLRPTRIKMFVEQLRRVFGGKSRVLTSFSRTLTKGFAFGKAVDSTISANMRFLSPPEKGKRLYVAMKFESVDHDGKLKTSPVGYMEIDRNGLPIPIVPVKRLKIDKRNIFTKGAWSLRLFRLEFKPFGFMWDEKWKFRLLTKTTKKLPNGLSTEACQGVMPTGSMCAKSVATNPYRKLQFTGVDWEVQIFINMGDRDYPATPHVLAFPPTNQGWVVSELERQKLEEKGYHILASNREMFFRDDTFGMCLLSERVPIAGICAFTRKHRAQNEELEVMRRYREQLILSGRLCEPALYPLDQLGQIANYRLHCRENLILKHRINGIERSYCKVLGCGEDGSWTNVVGEEYSQLEKYHVEHVFDKARRFLSNPRGGHGLEAANSITDFVMAWGAWNVAVSNLPGYNSQTEQIVYIRNSKYKRTWAGIRAEKELVYTVDVVRAIEGVLEWCDEYRSENGNWHEDVQLDDAATLRLYIGEFQERTRNMCGTTIDAHLTRCIAAEVNYNVKGNVRWYESALQC